MNPSSIPPPPPPPPSPHVASSSSLGDGSKKTWVIIFTSVLTAVTGIATAIITSRGGGKEGSAKAEPEAPVPSVADGEDKSLMKKLAGTWEATTVSAFGSVQARITLSASGTSQMLCLVSNPNGQFQAQTQGNWKIENGEFIGNVVTSSEPQMFPTGPFSQKLVSYTDQSLVLRDPTSGTVLNYRRAE